MQRTSYLSSATPKKVTLAEATWQDFHPFLSTYQWAFDDPKCSPRAAEIISALQNRGQKGSNTFMRENGWRYVLRPLHAWAFDQSIANHRRLYYVSYGGQALLYFDIDLHCDWQTLEHGQDAQRLIDALLRRFFGEAVVFWSPSSRGINGYLKVDLQGEEYEIANLLFDRLEQALLRFLAFCKNLADFEIKGKIGFLRDTEYAWKQYGKLPIHKDWSFPKLEEFKSKPTVLLASLRRLCEGIEAQVSLDVLERHKAYKNSLGDRPIFEGDYFLVTPAIEKAIVEKHGEAWRCMYEHNEDQDGNVWIYRECYRPGEVPLTGREWREKQQEQQREEKQHEGDIAQADCLADGSWRTMRSGTGGRGTGCQGRVESGAEAEQDDQRDIQVTRPVAYQRGPVNLDFSDLMNEPDSFKRQKEALMRYARYLKRVPTVEEGLQLIEDHDLFSAPWEQRPAKRKARVRDILKFIARTFDAGKCAHGSVNVSKYDQWAAKKFPGGLTGRTRSGLDENGNKIDGQAIHVSAEFIAVFMALCEFALIIDKNQDDSLPHHRAESIWEALYAKGLVSVPFCPRKWAVCREAMVIHGIVVITDRDYRTGKAMRWAVGPYFPFLGLWKGPKLRSLLGPGCFTRRLRRTEQEHNTLLCKQRAERAALGRSALPRPPPSLHVALQQ